MTTLSSHSKWHVLDTGAAKPSQNMQIDAQLLKDLGDYDAPILHLYSWEGPSATHGYFINPEQYLNFTTAQMRGLELAKRPTGGGITFHVTDYAFSLLVPAKSPCFSQNTLENYAFVNHLVARTIQRFLSQEVPYQLLVDEGEASGGENFCMGKPTKYDLMLEGKKVGGAAQRKTKLGFLHHGTICLQRPSVEFLDGLVTPIVAKQIQQSSYPLLGESSSARELAEARVELKSCLIKEFKWT